MAVNSPEWVLPDPLREEPPADQFCDLVLNGGVASGVVYPWALLELARRYRFKNIGGNSVGAMAAALAAAAEYGRCNGVENAFEPLRQLPPKLADHGLSNLPKMLRLFQPSASVRRLFDLFLAIFGHSDRDAEGVDTKAWRILSTAAKVYGIWSTCALLCVLGVATLCLTRVDAPWPPQPAGWLAFIGAAVFVAAGAALLTVLIVGYRLRRDLVALEKNAYGLCTGMGAPTQDEQDEGLVEWLHKGIQLSAGRDKHDPPLTFADLWTAPRFGRVGPAPLADGTMPPGPGIDLQMFTSNITQGRPVRLPLRDPNTRLYYDPHAWAAYFPGSVMAALERASPPYAQHSASDPGLDDGARGDKHQRLLARLRELPSGGMPIVVAARLSLCFPLLFSLVPVYAIDYEAPQHKRRLRRCWLADGGLCTNFPVHLFDAAHPQWPTFALLLDQRLQKFDRAPTWLPIGHLEGRGDNWQRGVPGAEADSAPRTLGSRLLGLAGGIVLTMKDWNDRVTGRLPQVRNRVIRLALRADRGEGQLNIAMSRETILRMAHEYGSTAGKALVRRFAPGRRGAKRAWREHVYVRSMIELRALRRHLKGYAKAVQSGGSTVPLRELLDAATRRRPLALRYGRPDAAGAPLTTAQRDGIVRAVQAIEALEAELSAWEAQFGPYRPNPEPELRLRPPI